MDIVFGKFEIFIMMLFQNFFPAVQHGDQVTLTCIHFFPPFVLLQYEYLDIVLLLFLSENS